MCKRSVRPGFPRLTCAVVLMLSAASLSVDTVDSDDVASVESADDLRPSRSTRRASAGPTPNRGDDDDAGKGKTPDPWADEVISFDPGAGGSAAHDDPLSALGSPSRMTGVLTTDEQVVSVFNPPFHSSQIVSIGVGGSLVVRFDEPVENDPNNPFGIDLLIFGNAFLSDVDSPDGQCGDPCVLFAEGGEIEVSVDGETWHSIEGATADGLFPTSGYVDLTSPYASDPAAIETSFTRPVDPTLTLTELAGSSLQEIAEMYRGSGGGAGVDLSTVSLDAISYVRISAGEVGFATPEIDALADVEPRIAGDVTGDGFVDVVDLLAVITNWGAVGYVGVTPGDANDDGLVNVADLIAVINNWSGS